MHTDYRIFQPKGVLLSTTMLKEIQTRMRSPTTTSTTYRWQTSLLALLAAANSSTQPSCQTQRAMPSRTVRSDSSCKRRIYIYNTIVGTSSETAPNGPVVDQAQQNEARAKLRMRGKQSKTVVEYESEEDDGLERNIPDYVDSSSAEDELDSDAEAKMAGSRKARDSSKKAIKTVKDLPVYAQHAYVASTYGLPKLPVPMVLLPGLRSRKPPPIPVPDLTKRSRGRHVVAGDDDGRKYHCTVAGCDK